MKFNETMIEQYHPNSTDHDVSVAAQTWFCEKTGDTPAVPDGMCPHCGRSIYTHYQRVNGEVTRGYTVHEAAKRRHVMCPHCMKKLTSR